MSACLRAVEVALEVRRFEPIPRLDSPARTQAERPGRRLPRPGHHHGHKRDRDEDRDCPQPQGAPTPSRSQRSGDFAYSAAGPAGHPAHTARHQNTQCIIKRRCTSRQRSARRRRGYQTLEGPTAQSDSLRGLCSPPVTRRQGGPALSLSLSVEARNGRQPSAI